MQNVTNQELVSLFETILLNDEKVDDKKSMIKMINAESQNQFKDFAKEKEIKVKDLKAAYKYYKQQQSSTEKSDSEDLFTLIAMVDLAAEQEAKEREGN